MDNTSAFFQKIRYDVHCPLATIAEQIYAQLSNMDRILKLGENNEGCHQYKPSVSGKTVSFITCYSSLIFLNDKSECEKEYNWALKALGKLFQIEVNPDDYPVSYIRVHISYQYPDMAKYIYSCIMREDLQTKFKTICTENLSDIVLEDEDTIGITCKTFQEIGKLWTIFLGYENLFTDKLLAEERTQKIIQEYNNRNALESSTNSLITSICVIIVIFGLMLKCVA